MSDVSTPQKIHDLALEAAKITLAIHRENHEITPSQIASHLMADYVEAEEWLEKAFELRASRLRK